MKTWWNYKVKLVATFKTWAALLCQCSFSKLNCQTHKSLSSNPGQVWGAETNWVVKPPWYHLWLHLLVNRNSWCERSSSCTAWWVGGTVGLALLSVLQHHRNSLLLTQSRLGRLWGEGRVERVPGHGICWHHDMGKEEHSCWILQHSSGILMKTPRD